MLNITIYANVLSAFSIVLSLLSEKHKVVSEILAISGDEQNITHMDFIHSHMQVKQTDIKFH